jgi:NhaP-type Na+/H+ or K+/H+ antiporter
LNSIVFLLIGFEVHFQGLVTAWRPVVAAFVAVMLARVVVVGGVTALVRPTAERIPWRWSAVMTWGGLRGALSMVLALALPATLPYRSLLITMTFGVVTLSLLGQGLSMPAVLRALKLVDVSNPRTLFEIAREEFRAARAAVEELDYLSEAGVLPGGLEARLRKRYGTRLTGAEGRLREAVAQMGVASEGQAGADRGLTGPEATSGIAVEVDVDAPTRESMEESVRRVERYLLDVERDRLGDALRAGQLRADAYDQLIAELDARRAALAPQ